MPSHLSVFWWEEKAGVRNLDTKQAKTAECSVPSRWNPSGMKLVILKEVREEPFVLVAMFSAGCSMTSDEGKLEASVPIFFSDEYMLNYVMATYSKAQVSILNGIVMGGGAGVSVHGRFRIATENTVFAMPETALGLFPDVGASYFLSRLPGFFGEYVGLTGARLDGAEMLAFGLATHFVPSTRLTALEADLYRVNSSDPTFASTILDAYTQHPHLKPHNVVDRCFSGRTVEEIISALEREAANEEDDWISATIQALKKASPASLKISLRSIREGRLQGVGQCLIREYRMVCHVMKGEISKDFVEGCRAILIDKDKNPKWEPWRLEDMKDSMVEQYFKRVEGLEDLKLPPRNNLPAAAIAKL
ncbi:unnamed protein product [Thlaspi arvense]|uniref:3-hydroxyisobutyryl-CoA hydrolase n=1 Tax=Thlaspi arvense TaxID=13288 RepID=A0AAU9RLC8_THLAR|nr:unnamed protein product [Thlaspi arvense]